MDQHVKELVIVVGLTVVAYYFSRRSDAGLVQNLSRLLTGLLGAFILLGGVAKFFEPFNTMFSRQISHAQLPFPEISAFAGQFGEIFSGLILVGFFLFGRQLAESPWAKLFNLANLTVVIIMLVAVYVHLHPDVPAEVLPLQSKPPVLTIVIMLLAIVNIWLRRLASKRN
ncbi:MAG: hypothetical protein GKR95_18935 [Gammaproteobacteria bacterium]|nr:hypothetical protein [Gammaproteobacteria bacterium]NKB64093.1 hypothetical protein [Gammaproteobacteria bacterium]